MLHLTCTYLNSVFIIDLNQMVENNGGRIKKKTKQKKARRGHLRDVVFNATLIQASNSNRNVSYDFF